MNKQQNALIYISFIISSAAPKITPDLYFFSDKRLFMKHFLKHSSIKGAPSPKVQIFPTIDNLSWSVVNKYLSG